MEDKYDIRDHDRVLQELSNDVDLLMRTVDVVGNLNKFEGMSRMIPNDSILLNTLAIQESKSSNEIESIVTTKSDIYKSLADNNKFYGNAKEIINYNKAVSEMSENLLNRPIITSQFVFDIQAHLEPSKSGLRKGPVYLKDEKGNIIFTPPTANEVPELLTGFTNFINENSDTNQALAMLSTLIGHHFFETIHPFYDGNGRTGRILIIASLINAKIISKPHIFVSRYINNNKIKYYTLIQDIRDNGTYESWKEFILFYLNALDETSIEGQTTIQKIYDLYNKTSKILEIEFKKIDLKLINLLFEHPYFTRAYFQEKTGVSKPTANRIINKLLGLGLISKAENNHYVNVELFTLLENI